MSWYGKIVGSSIGALFGPIGIVAGASFGHYFDSSSNNAEAPKNLPKPTPMSREKRSAILFNNTFGMMAKMAKADGFVTENEVNTVEKFMREPLLLNSASRTLAIKRFNQAKNNDENYDNLSEEFALAYRHDPKTLAMLFEMLLAIALADGTLHPNQDRLLLKTLNDFNLNMELYKNIRRDFLPDIDSLYNILGISADCDDNELKKRYRQLSRELHPDSLASANIPEKVKQLTEEKYKEINQAYDTLCKLRNIK